MNNKVFIRISTAITVLSLLAITAEVSDAAPQMFKVFALVFVAIAFNALVVIGLNRTKGDKQLRAKFINAMFLTSLAFFTALTLMFLRVLMPEDFDKSMTYISAGLFFASLLISSFTLGLVQATNNNRNENQ